MPKITPQPGDIVLYPITPKSPLINHLIGWVEILLGQRLPNCQYSHCAIVDLDTDYQIEAHFPKVRVSKIDPKRPKEIYRYQRITTNQRVQIIKSAYLRLGEYYDIVQLLG